MTERLCGAFKVLGVTLHMVTNYQIECISFVAAVENARGKGNVV